MNTPNTDQASRTQVAKSLQHLLAEMNLTKTFRQMARELGVTQSWVYQHLTLGQTGVQKRVLGSVAKGLGMETAELARMTNARPPLTKPVKCPRIYKT